MIGIMEKGKKIPPQEASRTNPVAKPEDTKGGINNKVSSGLIGKTPVSYTHLTLPTKLEV